ncbi:PspC domain-containing protein [Pseudofulvibacter geojedonensis]|uniref:PspC domain-containing protein n=1 Tax=Pseudofulvibacter geojedonensis TaxID=1123758 RepID=A0ABW3I5C6_9FLAO
MNKTVNINLGGMIFHIDENAYLKLQNYLSAVKRSFAGASGEDEIIADIEARIAELFSNKMQNERQVIGINEVDEIINIMGQPEDYMVDEDIFDEVPKSNTYNNNKRKLYRDTNNKYVGGVSSGLGHYFGINPIIFRLLFFILTFPTGGVTILIYILLWVLIPEARTTAEKIAMTGDPINIENIEKKIREGFDSASETVKNVDYHKYGNKAQDGISKFFDALGSFFLKLIKVFGKLFGAFLVFIGITTLISLVIGLLTAGSFSVFGFDFSNQIELYDQTSQWPMWLVAISAFFAVGIPAFVIAYLGFKILIKNLRSIGNVTKIILSFVWFLSLIGLIGFGVKSAISTSSQAQVTIKEDLPVTKNDTLKIQMITNENFPTEMYRRGNEQFVYDESDVKHILAQDIRLIVKSTKDSIANIKIRKEAYGNNHQSAKQRALDIDYQYSLENNTLSLNNYLLASPEQKYNEQEVEVTLYLPEGMVMIADENTYYYHRNTDHYNDILENGDEGHYLEVLTGETKCLDCPEKDIHIEETENGRVIINENGLNINISEGDEKGKVIIDGNGIDIDVNNDEESVKVKIDENGIKIKKDND